MHQPAREGGWSGRRGSNPRPTAWKAVTLPLSYSRLRVSLALFRSSLRRVNPPLSFTDRLADAGLASRSSPSGERRMVAREGLEPSKPLGRQIYSLLRLTASLPRQLAVLWKTRCFRSYLIRPGCSRLPGSSIPGGRWSWRRDLNPRPADYKSAALPG